MTPGLRSLIRKEARERALPFALATAWTACAAAYAVLYDRAHGFRAPVASFHGACLLYGLVAGIFFASRTALGETTQGTLGFTAALPVPLRTAALVRLGGAVAALVAPMLIGAVLMTAAVGTGFVEQVPSRPHGEAYVSLLERPSLPAARAVGLLWTVTAIAAVQATAMTLVLAVIGARRRGEATVGLIGVPLALAWVTAVGVRVGHRETSEWANWIGAALPQTLVINYGYGTEAGSYTDLDVAPRVWGPLSLNLVLLAALALWFARRYGTHTEISERAVPRRRFTSPLSRLAVPLPGRTAALVWLTLRQSVPLAAAGLLLAGLMTTAGVIAEGGGAAGVVAGRLPGSAWIVAILWAAVVAAAVFGPELQPRLEGFWRSRPISPSGWFWTKFLVGLAAVLGVLDGVTILVSWNSPHAGDSDRMSLAYVACMPVIHAAVYALAAFAVCRLRRPAAGAGAAIVVFFAASLLADSFAVTRPFEPLAVYNDLFWSQQDGPFRPPQDSALSLAVTRYLITYGALGLVSAVAALAAWRAVLSPAVPRRHREPRPAVAPVLSSHA